LAASVAGLPPELSVAGHLAMSGGFPHGGPTVGPSTVQDAEIVPVAEVLTSFENDGGEQLTETEVLIGAGSATVGWLGSLLHSRMLPIDEWVKPLPVTVSTVPSATPVVGLSVIVPTTPAAAAGSASTNSAAPVKRKSDAAICRTLTRRSRPDGVRGATAVRNHSPGGDALA